MRAAAGVARLPWLSTNRHSYRGAVAQKTLYIYGSASGGTCADAVEWCRRTASRKLSLWRPKQTEILAQGQSAALRRRRIGALVSHQAALGQKLPPPTPQCSVKLAAGVSPKPPQFSKPHPTVEVYQADPGGAGPESSPTTINRAALQICCRTGGRHASTHHTIHTRDACHSCETLNPGAPRQGPGAACYRVDATTSSCRPEESIAHPQTLALLGQDWDSIAVAKLGRICWARGGMGNPPPPSPA